MASFLAMTHWQLYFQNLHHLLSVKVYMPITWTDFDECVNDRIAYYQQQYDQATRIYKKLLKESHNKQQQVMDILTVQQMMTDELCRLRRLQNKYTSQSKTVIPNKWLTDIKPDRLN
jgi:wobble nucleotide-excising tRNase